MLETSLLALDLGQQACVSRCSLYLHALLEHAGFRVQSLGLLRPTVLPGQSGTHSFKNEMASSEVSIHCD